MEVYNPMHYQGLKVLKPDTRELPSLLMRSEDGERIDYWDWQTGEWRPGVDQTRQDYYSDEAFPMTADQVRAAIYKRSGRKPVMA